MSHAAHIKRRTEGTSNELSFSVLDAAKNAADSGLNKESKVKTSWLGGIFLFTLPGKKKPHATPVKDELIALTGSTSATLSGSTGTTKPPASEPARIKYETPVDEIARRKSRRRARKRLVIAAATVTALVLIGAAGSFFYKEHTAQSKRLTMISSAIADLSNADDILLEMDGVINSDMGTEALEKAAEIEKRLPEVTERLDTAEAAIQQADIGMTSASDKEAIARAMAAVSARRDMEEQGSQLMSAAVTAKTTADVVASSWENVIGADSMAREAADVIANTTEQNVITSKELSVKAKELFTKALADIESVQNVFAELDLSAQTAYISKRIEAMDYAIASDDAILAFNKEEATTANDAYNAADAEATLMAKDLPDDPTVPVDEGFDRETTTVSKLYNEARSRAATADAFLRDYLGANAK